MLAVVQRVKSSQVSVQGKISGKIGHGVLILLGVRFDDTEDDAGYLADKVINLRIFNDQDGKMNLSLIDVKGEMLVVSQFTLHGDTTKGRRPSYTNAAPPDLAERLYEHFIQRVKMRGIHTETGIFQAMMDVELVNDGPVTLIVRSKNDPGPWKG